MLNPTSVSNVDNPETLSPAERTPIVIQLCLRSRMVLWEKYYYVPFDITNYFSSHVGFTNSVVWSMRQSGGETKYKVPTVRPMHLRILQILVMPHSLLEKSVFLLITSASVIGAVVKLLCSL